MVTHNRLGNYPYPHGVIGYHNDVDGWNISRQAMVDRLGSGMATQVDKKTGKG
tara:strand:+ start:2491 stop:2649 length:159 start_codon:yes stop_codon:yes gene_type:complete